SLVLSLHPLASCTDFYPRSLHDALPICLSSLTAFQYSPLIKIRPLRPSISSITTASLPIIDSLPVILWVNCTRIPSVTIQTKKRSEEHTSELQSRFDHVCRRLLEKKNNR